MTDIQSFGFDIGATFVHGKGVRFKVWAPYAKEVTVKTTAPDEQMFPLASTRWGYFEGFVEGLAADTRYVYLLDGKKSRPDPASRYQPDGVHGPSAVMDPDAFKWTDHDWHGLALQEYVIYELHVGTCNESGTFDGIIAKTPH